VRGTPFASNCLSEWGVLAQFAIAVIQRGPDSPFQVMRWVPLGTTSGDREPVCLEKRSQY